VKTTKRITTPAVLALIALLGFGLLAGCSRESEPGPGINSARDSEGAGGAGRGQGGSGQGAGRGGGQGYGRSVANPVGQGEGQYDSADELIALFDDLPTAPLSDEELAGLLFMIEEERLARDLYMALGETWNLAVFGAIARSEAQHIETLESFAERYGIETPQDSNESGSFVDDDLSRLYDALLARGAVSVTEALAAAAEVEDRDIYDLERLIGESDNDDLRIAYQNLAKGSRNHLRSFVAQLERLNTTYTAQHIDPAYLDRILRIARETAPILDPVYTM